MGLVEKELQSTDENSPSEYTGTVFAQGLNDGQRSLYNSRIIHAYVEYLQKHYPEIDIAEVLRYAEISPPELEDPAHWFNQHQVDRFHTILAAKTGNKAFSREVGRFAAKSDTLGTLKKIVISLIDPASVYMLLDKLYPLLSRAVNVETKRIGRTAVAILVRPSYGVDEKAYQCQNRIGIFEGIGKYFSNQYASVDHPQCIHRGDAVCRYKVVWEKAPYLLWSRLKNIAAVGSIAVTVILVFGTPSAIWLPVSLLLSVAVLLLHIFSQHLKIKDLTETIRAQGNIAEEHLEGLKSQYDSSQLIAEIGSAAAALMDTQALSEAVLRVMQNRLSYDRGMLLLADSGGNQLTYAAGYGFDRHEKEFLHRIHFRLNNPASRGFVTKVFHTQQPFIVHDIDAVKNRLSPRSQRLIAIFNPYALVCVPIVYERRSLGVLMVDNKISRKKLQQSDLNLLKGTAANIATSINNAISYNRLTESEEKYRDMFENVSDFLYFHNLEGQMMEANASFKKALGYTDASLARMHFGDFLPAEYHEPYRNYLRDIVHTGRAEGITRVLKADGSILVVEYRNSLIRENGEPVGVRGSARDITERWLAEKEKRRLQGMLDRAKKMEAVGTLASGVAHDLNNILSGIVSFPELMLMDLPPNSKLRKPLSIIMESGQKASALVQDLLTMARRGVTTMEIININDIIREYLNAPEFGKILQYHPDVRISTDLDPNLLNIEGSPIHLFKTLMNLVTNAAEAMPEGGQLHIDSRNQYVDQAIMGFDDVAEGDYAVLAVSDTGMGITEKDQKHIFEPFYTKKAMGRSGTGLGMSVVWATVKDHKGKIDISSRIGAGTTVRLYFPISRKAKMPREEVLAIDQYRGNGESLLVVDDVAAQREIASQILTKLGYRVAAVESGESAVEYLNHQRADIVIIDMIMDPGIDGLETFKRIRKIHPGQRAVIVSGYSDTDKVKTAQALGAGVYVKKPYILKEIGMALKSALAADKGLR